MNKKSISEDSLVVQQVQVQYVVPGIDKKTAIFDILATDSEGRNRMTKLISIKLEADTKYQEFGINGTYAPANN